MNEDLLATVAVFLRRGDAEIARARLADAGLDALVQADDEGGLNLGFYRDFGIRLMVRSDDVSLATTILGESGR